MSDSKKPRSDSPLKTLPEARQTAIAEFARDHSLKETRAWLAADGFKTSEAALSLWLSSRRLSAQLAQNESVIEQILADLKSQNPALSEVELQKAGQMFFTALAIEQGDSLSWKRAQEVRLKHEAQLLAGRKIKLLETKAAQAEQTDRVLTNAELTPEQRAQRIKEIYGRA
jgi:hypothetical protein